MKPKISTGYLTPQAKKTKCSVRNRLSSTKETNEENTGFDEDLFQTLMKCPEKKKMILQLLSSNKEAINEYKKKEESRSIASPVGKLIKAKQKTCESPTALLRRRAIEQMNSSPTPSNRSGSSKPTSTCSEVSSCQSSPVPFNKVLADVIAFVEIKSRHDQDRSGGVKAVLSSMGAKVRDTFTNDVTHVIFKDGSYRTFQKAKLMKTYLVSILWVEFCRKTMQKQNEKQYPAMRNGFDDETIVCSQMQKEYEEIIREEYRRSIAQGTPLPTTKSFIDRRRTLMTPSVSNLTDSSSSFKTAPDNVSSQDISDKEVAAINGFQHSENVFMEDLVINDPECFSEVSGPLVNGRAVEKENHMPQSNMENTDMDLTCISSPLLKSSFQREKSTPLFESDMELTRVPAIYKKTPERNHSKIVVIEETPKSYSRNLSTAIFDRRKTINNCSSSSLISSDKSTDLSNTAVFVVPKSASRQSRRTTRSTSSFSESNESYIFGKNSAKSKEMVNKTASAMSLLKLSPTNNLSKSTSSKASLRKSTPMSNLEISSDKNSTTSLTDLKLTSNKSDLSAMSALKVSSGSLNKPSASASKTSDKSCMSALQLSSEKRALDRQEDSTRSFSRGKNTDSFASSRKGSLGRIKPVVEDIIAALQTPEFITVRKKSIRSSSPKSDDSEILSPQRVVHKKILKDGIPSANSSKEPKMLSPSPRKELVVQILKSPLDNLDDKKIQQKNRRKTLGSRKIEKPTSSIKERRKTLGPADSNNSTDNSVSCKTKTRLRKLYNPDESLHIEVDDEREREEKRNLIRKRKSDEGVFINPVDILKATSKTLSESDTNDLTPPKRTRKAVKNKKEEPALVLNSSADEQKDLLNEVLSKQKTEKPKTQTSPSRRKSTRIIKPIYKSVALINGGSCSEKKIKVPITPMNRRSTMEFMSLSQLSSSKKKAKKKIDGTKLPTIVCTKLHREDVQVFTQIVKKLGRFNVEDEVSERTTHIVAGESKRTINMLRGISRGCWIVKFDWVLQSLEEGKWLPEEDFEVTDFSSSVQKCRLERQAFGAKYTLDVFESCPPMYVASSTNPRSSDLKELIKTCKGRVVTAPRMAKIVVGQFLQQDDTVCVNETWILDCITCYRKLPFKKKYLLSGKRKSLIV